MADTACQSQWDRAALGLHYLEPQFYGKPSCGFWNSPFKKASAWPEEATLQEKIKIWPDVGSRPKCAQESRPTVTEFSFLSFFLSCSLSFIPGIEGLNPHIRLVLPGFRHLLGGLEQSPVAGGAGGDAQACPLGPRLSFYTEHQLQREKRDWASVTMGSATVWSSSPTCPHHALGGNRKQKLRRPNLPFHSFLGRN